MSIYRRYREMFERSTKNPVSSLPFHSENSCALAIATKTYLDELSLRDDPNSESARAETKEKGQGWVINSEFKASLNDAFHLWDAVRKEQSCFVLSKNSVLICRTLGVQRRPNCRRESYRRADVGRRRSMAYAAQMSELDAEVVSCAVEFGQRPGPLLEVTWVVSGLPEEREGAGRE